MQPPYESVKHLIDVFIEGGWAEEEDLHHLNEIHGWLTYEGYYDKPVVTAE